MPPAPKRPPPKLPVAEEDDITKQLADFQKKADAYIKGNSEGSGGAATASTEEQKTGGAPTNPPKSIYGRLKDELELLEDLHERRKNLAQKEKTEDGRELLSYDEGSHGAHNVTMCPTSQCKLI